MHNQQRSQFMIQPTACVIIIGNEILSGRTQDMNLAYIAQRLTKQGILLKEAIVIPDEEDKIIETVQLASQRYSYVFTTGGIGGTHDDITAACVAKAFGRVLYKHPEAFEILKNYYKEALNETRIRMAYVPEGATLIPNNISSAPGFQMENVYCLAGIPTVMQGMFDYLMTILRSGPPIHSTTVRSKVLENNIADELGKIQQEHPSVEIGSYPRFIPPHDYELNLVIRGIDQETITIVAEKLVSLIQEHGEEAQVE